MTTSEGTGFSSSAGSSSTGNSGTTGGKRGFSSTGTLLLSLLSFVLLAWGATSASFTISGTLGASGALFSSIIVSVVVFVCFSRFSRVFFFRSGCCSGVNDVVVSVKVSDSIIAGAGRIGREGSAGDSGAAFFFERLFRSALFISFSFAFSTWIPAREIACSSRIL